MNIISHTYKHAQIILLAGLSNEQLLVLPILLFSCPFLSPTSVHNFVHFLLLISFVLLLIS